MGRAIDQDNRLDEHERRLKLVEDALEELVQTRIHHVDLHDDEGFTPPAGRRKKATGDTYKTKKSNKSAKSSAEA